MLAVSGVGGHGYEVPGHGRLIFGRRQEPTARRMCVRHRLLRGEGFGGHQKQHGLRIDLFQGFGQIGAVHVRDEVHAQGRGSPAPGAIGLERLAYHLRSQVRSPDADVDDIGDRLAGVPCPRARTHGFAKGAHPGQDGVDIRHHVLAIHENGAVGAVAQRNVQDSAVFCVVVLLAGEHGLDLGRHIGLPRQVTQQPHGLLRHAVLGVVEQDVAHSQRETLEALRVTLEQLAHMH